MTVTFVVFGTPQPQGSKKAWVANGQARMGEAGGTTHAAWRNAVAQAANDARPDGQMLDGLLTVRLSFRFPMPASRLKAVRAAGLAPKVTAPDIDKLARAMLDGLMAGGLIRDDKTVARLEAEKWETTGATGCTVVIT